MLTYRRKHEPKHLGNIEMTHFVYSDTFKTAMQANKTIFLEKQNHEYCAFLEPHESLHELVINLSKQ
jgi:hypothetical protein